MTKQSNNNNNDDTMNSDPSPNDRARKKSREDQQDPNAIPMDYETEDLQPRDIFGATASSATAGNQRLADTNNTTSNQSNDPDDPDDQFLDANMEENKQEAVDLTEEEPTTDIDIPSPSPFLLKIDLANTSIWQSDIVEPSYVWRFDDDWKTEPPYLTTDLDGKNCIYEESLAFHVTLAHAYILENDNDREVASWMKILAYAIEKPISEDPDNESETLVDLRTIRRMAVRLALTDPVELFPSSDWKNGELNMESLSHYAWIASYWIFGAPWRNRDKWFHIEAPKLQGKLKRKSSERPTSSKNVGFSQNSTSSNETDITASTPSSRSQSTSRPPSTPAGTAAGSMYLSKALLVNPRHTAKVTGMKDTGRKYQTIIKIKFSKYTSDIATEQAEELSTCFKTMMDKLSNVDASILLNAFKDGSSGKPLKPRSEFPKSKDGISGYVDNVWMQKGKASYCRAVMSHDQPAETLFNDSGLQSWLSDMDLMIGVERIQAKKICSAGHLLGYHALAVNTENLSEAIQNQPAMKGIQVEVRSEFVKFGNKKGPAQRSKTKILQIYTSWDSASRARRALVSLYSSSANGQYPLGVQARFIPNVYDARFIRSPDSLLSHTNSLKKHVKFMNSTTMTSCHTIIELDHFNADVGMTLRQAIMSIFSSSGNNCTLFVAVDLSYYGDCVNFAYREDLENEAITMISALPLFLYASLGRQSIWNWFTSDARHEASYYTWDMDRGIVANDEVSTTDTKLPSWEQLDDDDEDFELGEETQASVLQPFRLLIGQTGNNAYSDHGTLVTMSYKDKTSLRSQEDDSQDNQDDDTDEPPMNIDSSQTSTTPSTITKTSDENTLFEKMADDPAMLARFEAMMLKRKEASAQEDTGSSPGTDPHGVK
jgi:hypothetical protein